MSFQNYPVLAGEVSNRFPFRSWAADVRFDYPPEAGDFLSQCQSAAEAWFATPFTKRPGVLYSERSAFIPGPRLYLDLQVPAGPYRIDCVVGDARTALAIELDGMQFHHRTREQVAKDYVRERRLVALGYTVIRFTAPEVFADPSECWRQVEAILERRGKVL